MLRSHQIALLEENKDTEGGGGGNAAPFTEEQTKALGAMISGAMRGEGKRLIATAVGESLKSINWSETLKLDEVLDGKLAKLIDDTGSAGDDGASGGGKTDPAKPDPEIQKQLTKLADELEKEKAARLAALNEAAETKRAHEFGAARQKLYESLKPHANETLHDVWVDNLVHHKRLKVEDGVPLLEVDYAPAKGMPKQKEFLPLEEAITHLVASDEAKRFQPAPGTENGRGSPGPRGGRRVGAPSLDSKDPAERVRARLESLGVNYDAEFGS